MGGEWIGGGLGLLAVAGQAVNVFLNLKLRTGQLESEKRVLNEVAEIYKRADVCGAEMQALEESTCALNDCPLRQPAHAR